ncbi:transporter substrate-binding domain-containing protein [Dialister hominis]|uniref:transporter substrate-binding domain-containing protein n=1 Tax=Dialister hominis TaxID=2582419 RepID=UPI003AB7B974
MNFSSLLKGAAAALALASVVTLAGCGGDKDAASSAAKSQAAGSKTYIVATRGTFRFFTYVDEKGNLTGYDVEILKEVEKRNPGIHFEYKMMPTSAAFVAIESGQADIVANQVGYTDERAAKTIYTKEVNNYTARKIASGMTGTISTALKI